MIKNGCLAVVALAALGCDPEPAPIPEAFQGIVEYQEVPLGFQVGGRIAELHADIGDDVGAAVALAKLDDEIERAARSTQVNELEVAVAQAQLVKEGPRREEVAALAARLRAADAEVERLRREHAREAALLAEGVTPRVVVDDLESGLDRAQAERDAIRQDLRRLQKGARKQEISGAEARAAATESSLEVTDKRLGLYTLYSPTASHVLGRHAEVGEVVAAGAPVFTLADVTRPYADVFVPQERIDELREGAEVSVRLDALQGPVSGRVESISRKTEFTPRFLFSERERPNLVVRVRIRIDDPDARVRAGLPAFVSVTPPKYAQPTAAVEKAQ